MQKFLVIFAEIFMKFYAINEFVTIRLKIGIFSQKMFFKQSMPQKPNKYGMKIFSIIDGKTLYTLNLEVCLRKQLGGPFYF